MITSTKSAAARSWLEWGDKLDAPREGCVCIIQQKVAGADASTGSTSGFHVGLLVHQDQEKVFLLGGNQSDSVKVSAFPFSKYTVRGYRWPSGIK